MKACCCFLVGVVVCLLPVPLIAQEPVQHLSARWGTEIEHTGGMDDTVDPFGLIHDSWLVVGKVKTLEGNPVPDAKIVVESTNAAGESRLLKTNLLGEFRTEFTVNAKFVKNLGLRVTATKKGFRDAHNIVELASPNKAWIIPVTLREPQEDPELLSQADLISTLATRLKTLGASDGLSEKGEKDYARGLREFLELKRPEGALPFFTKVIVRDPSCVQCCAMFSLAELASGDWDGAYRDLVHAIRKILADRTLGRPEPLLIYGVMEGWGHKPERAAAFCAGALEFAPRDPLALQELGRAELQLQNWREAVSSLSKALDAGAGPEARLLYVEALLGGDNFDAANQEMTRYLNGRDVKKMPPQVRRTWARVQDRKKVEITYLKTGKNAHPPIDYLHRTPPDLKGLDPATDQGPSNSILRAVGKNVSESFRNFPNTTSLEQIRQEKSSSKGKVNQTLDQKFRYLCFAPVEAWGPGFTEYRGDLSGGEGQPQGLADGFMLTAGFASASLIFHPAYQSQAAFRYLGRQRVNGRDAYVVAFAQQPEKARLEGGFTSGKIKLPTFSQGLAWVDPESFQILRLKTDLLVPLPELRLETETTEINFAEVHFKGLAQGFWLPQQVTVTVAWNGKHLRNEHQYSDFKLFNVETKEKRAIPKDPGPPRKKSQVSTPRDDLRGNGS